MKIILCIFLLNITAVSVFGQSVELHGIEGQSVKFPAAVKKDGFLMYSGDTIGDVTSGSFTALPNERFSGRLQWDSSTGLFSLSGLKMEDSGEYKVHNADQTIIRIFQLNVYKDNVPVSKPHVSVTGDEYPCTIECTAERGTGATLSWYREGEKKPYVSSRVASAPHLHLPVPVERSGTYTCEARNAVSRETSDPLTVGAHCTVFGQSVPLNGILGQSVEFPAAVKKDGFLMYSDVPIGDVTSGIFRTSRNENYRYRVQWDSSTGFFSLSGLKMEDSGEYKVQNTDSDIKTVFQLNVYIPVSKPHVSITHNEHPCTIECTAERGTGATLSWYREGEKKSLVSSRVASAPHLHLPETVESGTYTCEANNSVSRETSDPLTVGAHCTDDSSTIVASVIAAVVVVLIAVVFAVLYCRFKRKRRAVRTLIQVKNLIDDVDPHAYDETDPPNDETDPPNAVRTLIQVKKILDNVDPYEYGFEGRCKGKTRLALTPDAVKTFIEVKKLFGNVDPHEYGETSLELSPDDRRTLIEVTELLNVLDLHPSGFLIRCLRPEETKNLTSSHQTEVPLNQATHS